jgi:hypothetical protein
MLPPDLVLVSRVGSADIAPHPGGCPIQTYDQMPAAVIRDLGSIELAGSVPAGGDILAAVDQKACESGADAIVIAKQEERKLADRIEYHVIAEAIMTHPPAAVPSPESTPAESAAAPDAAGSSAAVVAAPAATPNEVLMQPVGADATNLEDTGATQRSNAMTESSIAATEAAPLAPVIVSPTAIAPATLASPLPIPSSLASTAPTPSATPTSTATATPEAKATPTPTPTPTIEITSTVTPTPESTATTTSTLIATLTPTATIAPEATVTTTATPTDIPVVSASATSTSEQSPGDLEATSMPSAMITSAHSPTPLPKPDDTAAPATPTATPWASTGASPASESSPPAPGD